MVKSGILVNLTMLQKFLTLWQFMKVSKDTGWIPKLYLRPR